MDPLPIDAVLPEVIETLRSGAALVLEAPPGAGKTTRVPPALLEAGLAGAGEILVLEPRRLAARMAARRVAEELGERPGDTIGWQVRFEDVSGPRTRIRYVTEALLTRRILAEPTLPGIAAIVLDEFHERHLQSDLALALLRQLRAGARPDLTLVVMSATLDAGPVARFLSAPSLRAEGRVFPVDVEFLSPEEAARDLRLAERVAKAVRRALREEPAGHVLVFLPGAAEIRRAREALGDLPGEQAEVVPLHGDLPPEEQDRAVHPSARRKVILSTNVAETSVTIEGVAVVVDSGLAHVASHSPWSGLPALELRKVSRASAAQRTGRAGRTRPGRCYRLYTRHDHDSRPEFDVPEIRREDLAETALALASLGASELAWLEPPPAAAWEAAGQLLRRLGALDATGRITALGQRLLRFPLHPRLARLVVAAEDAGAGPEGALLAALLGERDIRERWDRRVTPPTGPSDLLELASLFEEAARQRFAEGKLRSLGLSPGAVQAVERARKQIARLTRRTAGVGARPQAATSRSRAPDRDERDQEVVTEQALLLAAVAAFPDRVARRRTPGSDEVVLVGGGSARLATESVVREAPLLVAIDAEERRARAGARPGAAGAVVRVASVVTQEMLLDLFPASLRYEEDVRWNPSAERVDAFERLLYEDLVLEENRAARVDPERAAAVLAEAALARGARSFVAEGTLDRLLARMAFAAHHAAPDLGLTTPTEEDLAGALREASHGRRSFAELREADLAGTLLARLAPPQRAALDRLAPERVALPGGRSLNVHYEAGGKPAWVESRLQDFFGLAAGPRLAGGRAALTLHLLAPNQRAVQVTSDLAGFWERHYPALRRELMRRYPRHAWPEDPLHASPPAPRRAR